jgi:hypothetical protein
LADQAFVKNTREQHRSQGSNPSVLKIFKAIQEKRGEKVEGGGWFFFFNGKIIIFNIFSY